MWPQRSPGEGYVHVERADVADPDRIPTIASDFLLRDQAGSATLGSEAGFYAGLRASASAQML